MVEGWRGQASGARPSVGGPWKRRFLKEFWLLLFAVRSGKIFAPFLFFLLPFGVYFYIFDSIK